ncbi:FecCD family ABC transporter permease [Mahella australiensis]|uniref:Transport system permease protein n=1 Tax=Mahella australiensis (strain DSM 15567 / CIP 107919 / 50-1 BON) TaxID=697281 RepID=F4A150_MAHA5|nr:iron ABC transporter permease [Mahella australiensis]AEE95953.1 transport system permease protein [Mahella australiensis 50-1 BON]
MKNKGRLLFSAFMLAMVVILFLSILLAVSLGAADIAMADAFGVLIKPLPIVGRWVNASYDDAYYSIVWGIRLPRVLLAATVGMGLAVAGTAFQGLLQNPMADPYVLGVSSGASFGATISIVLGIGSGFMGLAGSTIAAFVGAVLTMAAVYTLGRAGRKSSMVTLLLAGIAVSSFLSAMVSFMMILNHDKLESIVLWTMGSFATASWASLYISFPIIFIGGVVLLSMSKEMNALLMGDETALHLGVDVNKIRKLLLVVGSLITASAVSVSGIIGFVGLIIPHVVRLFTGPDHRRLLPAATVSGAIFMIISDTLARTLMAPIEIPVGIITSLVGGPFFLYLLVRNRNAAYRG